MLTFLTGKVIIVKTHLMSYLLSNLRLIMPAHAIRERLIPYRILVYLLYAPTEHVNWLEITSVDTVRVYTGPASRALGMRIGDLRAAIRWLKSKDLIISYNTERKRGTMIVKFAPPVNMTGLEYEDKKTKQAN